MAALTYKHGEAGGENRRKRSPEYKCWESMKQRCYNPANSAFQWYGGRGISVDPVWRDDFTAFLEHIGRRPPWANSIDRIDGLGNYAPGNVRWSFDEEQARNRSNNRVVVFRGAPMTLVEASAEAGLPYKSVKSRVCKGWSVERALSTPLDKAKVDAQRNSGKDRSARTNG